MIPEQAPNNSNGNGHVAEPLPRQDRLLYDLIAKGLKICILDHGPITEEWTYSAVKRIVEQIVACEELYQITNQDLLDKLVLSTEVFFLKHELNDCKAKLRLVSHKAAKMHNEIKSRDKKIFKLKNRASAEPPKPTNHEEELKQVLTQRNEKIHSLAQEAGGLYELLQCWMAEAKKLKDH